MRLQTCCASALGALLLGFAKTTVISLKASTCCAADSDDTHCHDQLKQQHHAPRGHCQGHRCQLWQLRCLQQEHDRHRFRRLWQWLGMVRSQTGSQPLKYILLQSQDTTLCLEFSMYQLRILNVGEAGVTTPNSVPHRAGSRSCWDVGAAE